MSYSIDSLAIEQNFEQNFIYLWTKYLLDIQPEEAI